MNLICQGTINLSEANDLKNRNADPNLQFRRELLKVDPRILVCSGFFDQASGGAGYSSQAQALLPKLIERVSFS